ncbi:MAG TPA: MFS transporter, partial [Verrucomicrobiae bacterium]|nr:MFS transporter [Verrucomicrobiae bacterium]
IAFGTPGILMLIATVIFWLGRKKFVHLPPAGLRRYVSELFQGENLKALANLLMIVPFVAMFWALWQQNFSSWVLQSEKMDRHLFGIEWKPAQIQTVNPLFILIMLPVFSYAVYPALGKLFRLTPLRKIGMGLFVTALAFAVVGWIQTRIDAGQTPHILWQILAFVILTISEVLVSVTHLEFAYTQAPKKMKSLVMCTYLGAVSLGNLFTAGINFLIERGTLHLKGANYFFFFVVVMVATGILFVFFAQLYRGQTYIQDEQS